MPPGLKGYQEFLLSKMELAKDTGFEIAIEDINPILKFHQRDAVCWAVRGGRRALFESFGLGKTVQELEWCRIIVEKEGGMALIILPLGVKQEFTRDAVNLLGMEKPEYVRNMAEVRAAKTSIVITNYERVRDGDINPTYFVAVALDGIHSTFPEAAERHIKGLCRYTCQQNQRGIYSSAMADRCSRILEIVW